MAFIYTHSGSRTSTHPELIYSWVFESTDNDDDPYHLTVRCGQLSQTRSYPVKLSEEEAALEAAKMANESLYVLVQNRPS